MAKLEIADTLAADEIDMAISKGKAAPAPKVQQPSDVLRAQLARGEAQRRNKNAGHV